MRRSSPIQRKTPLKRGKPPARTSKAPRRDRPRSLPRYRRAQFTHSALTEAARRRSRGVCELCHDRAATDVHHRRMRSQGGADIIENALHLCRRCHHDWIHGNPDWAYRHNLLLRGSTSDHPPAVTTCRPGCSVDHVV